VQLSPFPARFTRILARQGSLLTPSNAIVVVEPFMILDVKNTQLNMPLLVPSTNATSMTIKPEVRPMHWFLFIR
jgi:hypothetical protein